jgi:rhodanese-related sulfurtransferase
MSALPRIRPQQVHQALRQRQEIALIDLREEGPHAEGHPLWAAQLSAGRLELDAPWRLPRREVPVVLFDSGGPDPEGLVEAAGQRLQALGYTAVAALEGGLQGWRQAGLELFIDVNVPSKAFGELLAEARATPMLPAEEVKALIDCGADLLVVDVRRPDEFDVMHLPGGINVPGGELGLLVPALAAKPATRLVVHCAGRTRGLLGTQGLINLGLPNPIAALRNGTIGWCLAGLELEQGQPSRASQQHSQSSPPPAARPALAASALLEMQQSAAALAAGAGAQRLEAAGLAAWRAETDRSLYCWDVRSAQEYAAGHRRGFGHAPGGQLIQETDVYASVRGARIVLADGGPACDAVRAPMAAHWLAQMGWEVAWMADAPDARLEIGPWQPAGVPSPRVPELSPHELARGLRDGTVLLFDLQSGRGFEKGHIDGAHWVLRSQMPLWWPPLQAGLNASVRQLVCSCSDGRLAAWAAADLGALSDLPVAVLAGGQAAWLAAGLPLVAGSGGMLSPRIDRYRRPYEGTEVAPQAMQAYLDWEYGLVAQLQRDGSHGFHVLEAAGP